MEGDTNKLSVAQREIELKMRTALDRQIQEATDNEIGRYHRLLNAARRNRLDEKNPGPVSISIEERLNLIKLAKSGDNIDTLVKESSIKADPIKMQEKWDGATRANDGRPPIGGAPDD